MDKISPTAYFLRIFQIMPSVDVPSIMRASFFRLVCFAFMAYHITGKPRCATAMEQTRRIIYRITSLYILRLYLNHICIHLTAVVPAQHLPTSCATLHHVVLYVQMETLLCHKQTYVIRAS